MKNSFWGESIGKINDKIICTYGLPGDELKKREDNFWKKDYCRGLIEQIIKPSKDRILMPWNLLKIFQAVILQIWVMKNNFSINL